MKKDSRANHARYVELNLFPEEKEDYQKDTVSSENEENHTSPDKEYDLTGLFERLSKSIIRKTKCFRILERNAKISKTKRNFSRLYPTPQKFKKIDRLRRNEIHLKAVRTSS